MAGVGCQCSGCVVVSKDCFILDLREQKIELPGWADGHSQPGEVAFDGSGFFLLLQPRNHGEIFKCRGIALHIAAAG